MHSPGRKPRRWLTRKEKGKKKVSDSGTDRSESDRRDSDSEENGDETSKLKSTSAEKASTSANERLRQYTRQRNPVVRFVYNDVALSRCYAHACRIWRDHGGLGLERK